MATKQYHYPKTEPMADDFDFTEDHNFKYDVDTGAYTSPVDSD
jgi:hypothetical protein